MLRGFYFICYFIGVEFRDSILILFLWDFNVVLSFEWKVVILLLFLLFGNFKYDLFLIRFIKENGSFVIVSFFKIIKNRIFLLFLEYIVFICVMFNLNMY